ncbi:MAG: P27 family phage terminase small subunit [Vicinamibacterales bacterium]
MKAPADLGPAGVRYWKAIVKTWKLDAHQPEILAQACRCLDVIAKAELDLQAKGPVVADRFGQVKPNPAALVVRDYRGLFARLVRELGLSGVDTSDSRPPALTGRYAGRR